VWGTERPLSTALANSAIDPDAGGLSASALSPYQPKADGPLPTPQLPDYGWGLGLRSRNGQPLYIHGGEWTGCTAKAVRSPATGIAVTAMSSGASMGELTALIEAVLEQW
jgi:hypothetical protein